MPRELIVARTIAGLGTCRVGNHQVPKENLFQDFICDEHWTAIGLQAGWRLEAGPTQVILVMLLKHIGEHGNVEDVAMACKRILESRAFLKLHYAGKAPAVVECCIYCNASMNEARDNLVQFGPEEDVPEFWHCPDHKECQARFAALFRGQAVSVQQAPPSGLVTQ